MKRFASDFHSWLRHWWKLLVNRLTRDPKIIIHANLCIILYILSISFGIALKIDEKNWKLANTASGFDWGKSGNKPLPDPMLIQIYVIIWHH